MKKTLVVLAAGMGSRYGGLKQLDSIGPAGETIIEYSLFDAINAGFDEVVFIIRESFFKEFQEKIGSRIELNITVSYVFQELDDLPEGFKVPENREKPWGTGHALICASNKINNPFLIINGDDFYGTDAFLKAADAIDKNEKDKLFGGMVGYQLENTLSENGAVSRGICIVDSDNCLKNVIETHQIKRIEPESEIQSDNGELSPASVTSMNLWYFSPSVLTYAKTYFEQFLNDNLKDPKAEFYLPAIANKLINMEELKVDVLPTYSRWYGVTFKEDKRSVCRAISEMIKEKKYPQKLWGNI